MTLFVAWRYPPSVGGMQNHAANLYEQCSRRTPTRLVALGRQSKIHILWFFPWAMATVFTALVRGRADRVLCADAVTLMVLRPVLWIRRPHVAVVVYGLDLLVRNPVYQLWLRAALRRPDRVVAISDATAEVARGRGVDDARLVVLRPGVAIPGPEPTADAARRIINGLIGVDSSAFVVLTLGRLVRRKGVRWFVSSVLPRLPGNVVYVSAGTGPEERPIREAGRAAGVTDRLRVLGGVDGPTREALLRGADIFLMPNVRVEGDMEGFGLVAAEAAMRGTPVVAAAMEGIADAVIDNETGILCAPMDTEDFVDTIASLESDRNKLATLSRAAAAVARDRFSLERMDDEFAAAFDVASSARSPR